MKFFTAVSILLIWNTYAQTFEITETFQDSLTTKDGDLFLINITRKEFTNQDFDIATVQFHHQTADQRVTTQTFEIEKDKVFGMDPISKDYNNDGYTDLSIISNFAARGSNSIRTLFLFNPEKKKFIHIKNSESYPNLQYNKGAKCINSYAFHGGTTQFFLQVKSDSLVATYSIDIHGFERVLRKYENGESTTIKRDSIKEIGFPYYKSFDPYIEVTEED